MKEFIKYLIQNNKFFKILYREINYLLSMPIYFFNYKLANPNIDVENINKVVFVAHPDDEIVSMGNFILNNSDNLLVICFTNGGNKTRLKEFQAAMTHLNVQYQIWNFKDAIDVRWSERKVLKKISSILNLKEDWEMVITHNFQGDYGHFQHKEVSRLINKAYKGKSLYMPMINRKLFNERFKLSEGKAINKRKFFEDNYKSQRHILNLYSDYFKYEKIISAKEILL